MRRTAPLLSALACLLLCADAHSATRQASHRYDPGALSQYAVAYQINKGHSGNITLSGGFSTPLTQMWSVNLGGTVSYPVIAQGMVFVTVGGDQVFAIDLATGATVWEKVISGYWSAAAYDNKTLFVV